MRMMSKFLAVALAFFTFTFAQAKPGDRIKYLPVQDGGRVKPYDTFSSEVLELVYGKKTFEGREATEIVFTWMLSPSVWQDKKIFEVRNHEILKLLGLGMDDRYYTSSQIFGSPKFSELMQELQARQENKEKLTPYFQALQRIESQFVVFREMAGGQMLRLLPPKPEVPSPDSAANNGSGSGSELKANSQTNAQTGSVANKSFRGGKSGPGAPKGWISVAEMNEEQQKQFMGLTKAFVNYLGAVARGDEKTTGAELDTQVDKFMDFARKENPEMYSKEAQESKIDAEVFYNSFHPFRWTYTIYLTAAMVLLGVWLFGLQKLMPIVWLLTILGWGMHTYGFGLRVFLMDRPPVSNMYETVVWMSWGCLVFATVIELTYKFRFVLLAGLLGSVFALVVADSAPVVLDPSFHPLEPVLRSNYWLIVHVMTITISYAAFFLAFALGEIGLLYFYLGEEKRQEKIKTVVMAIYRAIQIGVCFLAPGIILGGVWADYSWGRFWGWDPKETWALIALLGYVAVLHGRMAGWVRNFGMVAMSIVTFNLVIMAWYGVNFVLGAGLHSYGFGAGGIEYVAGFVGFHLLAVGYLGVRRVQTAGKQ